ncbi:sulfate ABC transporter permease subunit CysW [Aciduricibacillus chroicocephali]|uniref:Sulfate ABC transporter permease subunit CysW n=1 Tax=Aciduricibacillus chroicocephali TaxID=3054939 RepID=A0ABY9KYV4_9BACI|nr:sulfate ABC transporter permease subunit CysW [Bacillaceae bacterium 44XB]
MEALETLQTSHKVKSFKKANTEPRWLQGLLISIAVLFIGLFLIVPMVAIFTQAFAKGADVYWAAVTEPDALSAIKLTLLVLLISLPINVIFGIAAAWLITRFRFRGKNLLLALIDLPFAVSPVIAGLVFILLFSSNGLFGPFLEQYNLQIVFALPGIVLATLFVTMPFIAKELIPVMQAQGREEEEAARTLGANSWHMFRYVTFPNIKWGLLYGVILCSARTVGEFGAVSVVSGHIRGLTNTLPLHIEILYNEYQFSAAFAAASLLSIIAIFTIVIQHILHYRKSGSLGRSR